MATGREDAVDAGTPQFNIIGLGRGGGGTDGSSGQVAGGFALLWMGGMERLLSEQMEEQ